MTFKTSFARVAGLGSAKEGTHHWWGQRLSSLALIPLAPLFVFQFGCLLGESRQTVLETMAGFPNSLLVILFLVVGFQHLRQGLQVVIEDYVHARPATVTMLILNNLLCWGFMIAGIWAVVSIALQATG